MQLLSSLWTAPRKLTGSERISEPFPYRAWKWAWQKLPARRRADSLFSRLNEVDWDVVLILDACRYDALQKVADEAVVDSVYASVSSTPEFLDAAKELEVFENAAYISANPQTKDRSPGTDIDLIPTYEELWDERLDTVPASPVLETVRDEVSDTKRVVGHLIQPHYPHICEIGGQTVPVPDGLHPQAHGMKWVAGNGFQEILASGQVDLSTARESYDACVDYAWDNASAVAANLAEEGYRVVITADHGECFGEWGFVEHPVGVRIKPLVRVPWVVFEPPSATKTHETPTEQLAALGYR